MSGRIEDILAQALAWQRDGAGAALATVLQTWGSAPRPAGSVLAVSGAGDMAGSVSGGCVEGDVVLEALEALQAGAPRVLEYGVSDDDAIGLGLACGGTIRILVEPICDAALPETQLAELVEAIRARRPIGRAVLPGRGGGRLLRPAADATGGGAGDAIARRFRSGQSGFQGDEFIVILTPPVRVAVVGAVHIAQALLPMLRLAGFDAHLIDPRGAFGSASRFPGEEILDDWPDEALTALGPDRHTAVVTLTHDPKLDDPAIRAALAADVFYLGCLGSRRTHARRLERLAAAGLPDEALARIHAPVGLDIGAAGPGEIAASILAEIIATLRRGQ